jgi:peptidyl-prolyl cis-trans isomerase SurA
MLILVLAVTLSEVPALGQTSIKIVVNDSPITSYDIANRERFLKLISGGRFGEQRAIEELIDEQLKMQEAKRRNVTIPESEVDQAFARIAKSTKLTPDKLTQALTQQGVNPVTLKNRIRADLAWNRIVRADARTALTITEQDVADALGGEVEQETEIAEYTVRPIVFVVPKSSSKSYDAQRKQEAESFRGQLESCDQAETLAKGLRDVTIRTPKRVDERQLGEDAEIISTTPVGKATAPRKTQIGYEMFAICEKKSIKGTSMESAEARNKLQGEAGERFARRKLRDLKSEAMIEYR